MEFKDITNESMREIWPLLSKAPGRTTDFSYGGLLMWIDYFKYRYCIEEETLFIKGVKENDREKLAFSLPVGKLPLKDAIGKLKEFCKVKGIELEFSAVPECAIEEMRECGAKSIEELTDWGDYLYEANSLATLSGKKMSKKRNRFNKFEIENPEWRLEHITPDNIQEVESLMDKIDREEEGSSSESAVAERALTRKILDYIAAGDKNLLGAILYTGDESCAFTVGDIKGDTLFIHIEKGLKEVAGSFETINKMFVEAILASFPGIEYVNREDDAGDPGLKIAKESYHPIEILKKYNVKF